MVWGPPSTSLSATNVAWLERRGEELLGMVAKGRAGHRSGGDQARRNDTFSQSGEEGGGVPMAMRCLGGQAPLVSHLVLALRGETGEAEGRLDDAEYGLDGLLTQLVEGAARISWLPSASTMACASSGCPGH